eukprot:g75486.t1
MSIGLERSWNYFVYSLVRLFLRAKGVESGRSVVYGCVLASFPRFTPLPTIFSWIQPPIYFGTIISYQTTLILVVGGLLHSRSNLILKKSTKTSSLLLTKTSCLLLALFLTFVLTFSIY